MSPPEETKTGANRRQQKRIEVGLTVIVHGKDLDGTTFEEVTSSSDISRTGLSFLSPRLMHVGMEVEIFIPRRAGVPDPAGDFTTTARVVRFIPGDLEHLHRVGILFVGRRYHRVFVPETPV